MTAGLRYDFVKAETDGAAAPFFITSPQSDSDSQLSGEFGLVYKIDEATNIYANTGRAFRAPTLIERYFFGPHDGPAQDRGNPDLNPETSLNFDVGVRTRGEKYQLSLSLYYNRVDELIRKSLINPGDPVAEQIYQYQNISDAEIYGGEIDMKYFVTDAWSLFCSGTVTKGEDKDTNDPLTGIPPFKARYGVQYEREWGDLYTNLELSAESAMGQDDVGSGERETPGYSIMNIRAYLVHENGISVSLSVENVLDKNYYDHLSYGWQQLDYASHGRNAKFELNYKF